MQHPDEGTIHAWIDGELSADDAAALEAHLKECAECSAVAAEARGLVAASSRIVSALDTVPGDVIPKTASRRRPWYASTQLRAAAAVIIVAGVSFLVTRERGVKQMERVVNESAPASAPAEVPIVSPVATMAAPRVESAAAVPPPPLRKNPERVAQKTSPKVQSPKTEREADERSNVGRRVALDQAVTAASRAPEKVIDAPASVSVPTDEVAARRDALSELKKVRIDSARNETVFEVEPGVEVTLTDNGQPARLMLRASAQAKERQAATPTAASPPPATGAAAGAPAATALVINSISWTSKHGHVLVLKGPLSKEELEKVRQRLPEDQR